jgi:hypothetical protein
MPVYEIRVHGHLSPDWEDELGGLQIRNLPGGEACLSGTVADQAALHGILIRIRDLGLPLLLLRRVGEDESSGEAA